MRYRNKIVYLALAALCCAGCETVKGYQMKDLRDDSMQTNATSIEKLEGEAESYREGASGGIGGKNGGGCGCN
jgi:hypothetical protein